ncbi:MAG: hypothetical protein RL154_896 [Pseudomonadota bacterium]|jgi:hypothetical protein
MNRFFYILSLCTLSLFALDSNIQDSGVEVKTATETIIVKREIDLKCFDIDLNAKNSWGGDYALQSLPAECKKTFVTTFGTVSPISINGVTTFGELETLDFM